MKRSSVAFLISVIVVGSAAISLISVSEKTPLATIAPHSQLAQVADITTGLVGWWKFDETSGNTAADSSGNGYTATVANATWIAGKFNGALSFNGTNAVVNMPANLPAFGDFTASAWIYATSNSGNHVVWETADGGSYFQLVPAYSYTQMSVSGAGGTAANIPTSQWTHVVLTRSGSTVTAYENGQQFGTAWNAGTAPVNFASMTVGSQPHNWGYWFQGNIDDFRIYNRALSASDVTALYQTVPAPGIPAPVSTSTTPVSAAPVISNVAASNLTTSGATISWVTDAPADSKIEYGLTSQYGNNTTLNTSLVTSHNQSLSGLQQNTLYHYRVDSTDSGGSSQSPDQIFTTIAQSTQPLVVPTVQNLTGQWTFDEGTGATAGDWSGNNNTASIVGAAWSQGDVGPYALSFDGATNYADIHPYNSTAAKALTPLSGNFTISAWVKPSASVNGNQQVWSDYGSNTNDVVGLALVGSNGNENVSAAFRDGNGVILSAAGATSIPLNVWTHIVAVKNGTSAYVYVNSVQDGSGNNPSIGTIDTSDGTDPAIGRSNLGQAYFHGSIDDVRIYNRALSLNEIQGIYAFTGANAITPVPPRNIPPIMSNPGPNGFVDSSATQTTLVVTTDEPAVCKYSSTPGTLYAAMTSTFSTTGGTAHSSTVAVSAGTNYSYYIRCADALGNTDTTDTSALFSRLAAADSSVSSGNVIPADRVSDWTKAGIPGGIPPRTTICATLSASTYGNGSVDAGPAIQSVANSCPDNQVVLLSTGTFLIASPVALKHPVVLRGAGAQSTILNLATYCALSLGAAGPCSYPGAITAVDWTGGLAKGSTSIILSSTAGLRVGEELVLDELNDPAIVNVYAGNGGSVCTSCGRNGTSFDGGNQRTLQQMVKIVSINGSMVSIDQPIQYTHLANLQPQAWNYGGNVQNVGLEDMSVNENSHGQGINLAFCSSCWISGLKTLNNARNAVSLLYAYQNEIRNSYLSGGTATGPGNYGIELNSTHSSLIDNNIIDQNGPILSTTPASGNVIAYNYALRAPLQPGGPMEGNFYTHAPTADMNLFEGNVGTQIDFDDTWGSSSYNTVFRNYLSGYETNALAQETPIIIEAWNRYENIVGNVLGMAGFHNNYEQALSSYTPDVLHNIFTIGYMCTFAGSGGACTSSNITTGEDPATYYTLLRHGNFDAVSNTIKWEPAIANHSLPPSLYLSSKPSWFGSIQWPPIGPDVSGGPFMNGMVYAIPAESCYQSENLGNGGTFDPSSCYSGSLSNQTPTSVSPTSPVIAPSTPSSSGLASGASPGISVTFSGLNSTAGSNTTASSTCISLPSAIPASALALTAGSRGTAVVNLQTFLVISGYLDQRYITGYYGNLTKAALASYQAAHPTSSCNIQSPSVQTISNIPTFTRSLTVGSRGEDVRQLQIFLNSHGFLVASSGNGSKGHETAYFGPATTKAVAALQRAYNITPAYGYFGTVTRGKVNQVLGRQP